MQIEIIANPVAGGGKSKKVLNKVEKILNDREVTYRIHWTDSPGHATQLAEKLEWKGKTLVAAGGDGTVMEVLNGIASPKTKIGIIPAGMGNDFTRCLGVPKDARRAVDTFFNGDPRKVDLGTSEGKLFNFMGVGFPAEVVKNVELHRNGVARGLFVYLLGLVRSITQLTSYQIELEVDGEKTIYSASAVFVASCRYTGGGIKLIPHADPSDGLLDVALIHELGRIELTTALRGVYSGAHVDHPKIEFFRGRSIKIRSENGLAGMYDGELKGSTPVTIEAAPAARRIIVPRDRT
ncbi:MAG: diacylglycerol/lipid kinase family protein [Candidatus Bipolaricaulota bacterium]